MKRRQRKGMWPASLVVPLKRQRDAWLRQCVRSAVSQTVPCEVIVVTHPETPASNLSVLEGIRQGYPDLTVETSSPVGFAAAINHGFSRAGADRVGLVLSDDWLEPDTLERCLEHCADIVCTGIVEHDAQGAVLFEKVLTKTEFHAQKSLEAKASYLEHFFLFERSRVEEAGGVDESIGDTGPDDFDLIWTLLERGATVEIVEAPLYHYRDHFEERLTLRDRKDQVRDLNRILDKHGVFGPQREKIVARHAAWFGRPDHVVLQEIQAGARPAIDRDGRQAESDDSDPPPT